MRALLPLFLALLAGDAWALGRLFLTPAERREIDRNLGNPQAPVVLGEVRQGGRLVQRWTISGKEMPSDTVAASKPVSRLKTAASDTR